MITVLEKEPGYIAGVTNHVYLINKKCHDVSCRVDEGKLTADPSYSK
jgi:hypothetical protein